MALCLLFFFLQHCPMWLTKPKKERGQFSALDTVGRHLFTFTQLQLGSDNNRIQKYDNK